MALPFLLSFPRDPFWGPPQRWPESIVDRAGQTHQRVNVLHSKLMFRLEDVELANTMWRLFKQYAPEADEEWLIRYAPVLFNRPDLKLSPPLSTFISQLNRQVVPIHRTLTEKIIAVIAPLCAGESQVAQPIRRFLKEKGYTVVLIDPLDKEYDPLYIFSGGFSSEDLYWQFDCQNPNDERGSSLWHTAHIIKHYIPPQKARVVVDKIEKLASQCIISLSGFASVDLFTAHILSIPMLGISCDLEIPLRWRELADMCDPNLITLAGAVAPPPDFPLPYLTLGNMVREEIVRVDDPKQLSALRKKHSIAADARLILIMLGNQGVGIDLLNCLHEISTQKYDHPLHFVIICGKNRALLEQIQQFATYSSFSMTVLGWTEPKTLSDYYNMANGFFGKLGGSTCRELRYMGLFSLGFAINDTEEGNLKVMIEERRATAYLKTESFATQFKAFLSQTTHRFPPIQDNDWKRTLNLYLSTLAGHKS